MTSPDASGEYRYEKLQRNAADTFSNWDKYERQPYDECGRCGEYDSTIIIYKEQGSFIEGREKGGKYCYNCGKKSDPQGEANQKWIQKHIPNY